MTFSKETLVCCFILVLHYELSLLQGDISDADAVDSDYDSSDDDDDSYANAVNG